VFFFEKSCESAPDESCESAPDESCESAPDESCESAPQENNQKTFWPGSDPAIQAAAPP